MDCPLVGPDRPTQLPVIGESPPQSPVISLVNLQTVFYIRELFETVFKRYSDQFKSSPRGSRSTSILIYPNKNNETGFIVDRQNHKDGTSLRSSLHFYVQECSKSISSSGFYFTTVIEIGGRKDHLTFYDPTTIVNYLLPREKLGRCFPVV